MTRRFEYTDAKSNKFWEITVTGKTVTLQYGRIGTDGQSQAKSFATPAEAKSASEKQVAEKLKKGYRPVGEATAVEAQHSKGSTTASKATTDATGADGKDGMPWNSRTKKWRSATLVALAEGRTRLEFILPLLRDDPDALRAAAQGGLLDDELTEAVADTELERLSFRYVGDFDAGMLEGMQWELNRRTSSTRRRRGDSQRSRSRVPAESSGTPLFSPTLWTGTSTAEKWARRITKSANWRTSRGAQDPSDEFFTLKKMPQQLRSDPDFIGPLLCSHGIIALAFAAPELQSDPDILRLVFSPSVTEEGGSAEELVNSLESCLRSRSAQLFGPATVPPGARLAFGNEGYEVHVICLAQEENKKWKNASEVRSTFLTWAIENSEFAEPDIAAIRIRSKVTNASGAPDCASLDYEVRSPYNNTIPSTSKLTFFVREGDDVDDEFEFEDEEAPSGKAAVRPVPSPRTPKQRTSTRSAQPSATSKQAPVLDTTGLSPEETVSAAKKLLGSRNITDVRRGLALLDSVGNPDVWVPFAEGAYIYEGEIRVEAGASELNKRIAREFRYEVALWALCRAKRKAPISSLTIENASIVDLGALSALKGIKKLTLSNLPCVQDLRGIEGLTSIKTLAIYGLEALQSLAGLRALTKLESVSIWGCGSLSTLEGLPDSSVLTSLDVKGCALVSLSGLEQCRHLRQLKVSSCEALSDVTALRHLASLTELKLSKAPKVRDLDAVAALAALERLDIGDCEAVSHLDALSALTALETLHVGDCDALSHLADFSFLQHLAKLQTVGLSNFDVLEDLRPLSHLKALSSLVLDRCPSLVSLKGIESLTSLTRLFVWDCDGLTSVADVRGLPLLEIVTIRNAEQLITLEGISDLPNLERLSLNSCDTLSTFDGIANLPRLESVECTDCRSLMSIDALHGMASVKTLSLEYAASLSRLAALASLEKLKELNLRACDSVTLESLKPLAALKRLQTIDLIGCAGIPTEFRREVTRSGWDNGGFVDHLSRLWKTLRKK